ncbi:MAG: FKBP-type peptidyl-prolyl cis-trans isomerase [Bacteroidales bacterium]
MTQITKNKVVSLSYELRLQDENGQVVENVSSKEPLTFIYGIGQLLPTFESEISNLKVDDTFQFTLRADEAYGPFREEAVVDLPMKTFEIDGKVDESMLVVGNQIPMMDQEGNRLNGTVAEVKSGSVKMDFNHPLAGQDLYFKGEVVDVRDATEEELDHGHVHSGGDHPE